MNQDTDKKRLRGFTLFARIARTSILAFLSVVSLLLILSGILLLGLWIFLTPERATVLLETSLKGILAEGAIQARITDVELLRGVTVKDIRIHGDPSFEKDPFLSIDSLEVTWDLPALTGAHIRVPEIIITKPILYLTQGKDGIWNVERLFASEKAVPEEPSEPMDKIDLPLTIDLLLNLSIRDLRVILKTGDTRLSLKGVDLEAGFTMEPTDRIPMDFSILDALSRARIELNPDGRVDFSLRGDGISIDSPLSLMFLADMEKRKGGPGFTSHLLFSSPSTSIRFPGKKLPPLDFRVAHDLFYEPADDILQLKEFSVSFRKRTWLKLNGSVKSLRDRGMMNIRGEGTGILLDDLYPYYRALTGDRNTRFGGNISFSEIFLGGSYRSPDMVLSTGPDRLSVRQPGRDLRFQAGKSSLTLREGGKGYRIESSLEIPNLTYTIGGSPSKRNSFRMNLKATTLQDFSSMNLENLTVKWYDPYSGDPALFLSMEGNARLRGGISGELQITTAKFAREPMLAMAPKRFHRPLKRLPLREPVTLNATARYGEKGPLMTGRVILRARLPEYELDDLRLAGQADLDRSTGRIVLKEARLYSDRWNLNTILSGSLRRTEEGIRDADISLLMTMKQETNRLLYDDWNYKGSIRIESRLKGDPENAQLKGSLDINNLFLSSEKELIDIRGLSCDIPWNILVPPPTVTVPLFTTSKDELIRGKSTEGKSNFTLTSASASHPARSSLLTYVKDARANITIDENILRILNFKGNVLRGTLYGRDISINLSDLSPGKIEFGMDVNLNEADISILDKPVRGREKDARLSLNARFRGKGIDLEKELTATGYVNIYQIGERFANRLMRGLSTEKGKSKLGNLGQFAVDNTMKINSFNFTLDKGLVYTTVMLDKRLLGLFVGVKNDRIEFERIPLQEYLRKVARGK